MDSLNYTQLYYLTVKVILSIKSGHSDSSSSTQILTLTDSIYFKIMNSEIDIKLKGINTVGKYMI